MKEIPILQTPDPVLHTPCSPIPQDQIGTAQITKILNDMRQALHESGDGVAIAAPQIGQTVRIFVVSGFVLDQIAKYHGANRSPDKVFINPEIIKASKTKKDMKGEGCLSVRWKYGTTTRSDKVTVKAIDENGKEFKMDGMGLLAQIFQHEIEHLNGILFIDHAHDIKEMDDEEKAEYIAELERMKASRKLI